MKLKYLTVLTYFIFFRIQIYAAYKIKLDANKTGIPSCTAPSDKDNVIRKEADGPPPAPEGSTAVVVPPKIETLEEKKIRKLKYKKQEQM